MSRNYAAVPHEYLEEMSELSDEEFGRLMRGLLLYSREGTPIQAEGNERFYAKRVMNREDGLKASYEEIAERNRSNGRKGGRPRKNPETQKNPEEPKETKKNPEEPKETQKTQDEDEVEVKDEVKSLVKFTSLASSEFIGGIGESEGEDACALPAAEERTQGGGEGAAAPGAPPGKPGKKARKPTARQKAIATYEEMAGKYAQGAIPPKVDEQFRRWIGHRYEKRAPITDTAMAGMLQKTADAVLQYGEDRVAELFDLCITSGWTGVFFERLKEQPAPRGQPGRKAAGPRDQAYDFDSLEKTLNAAGG